MRRYCIQEYDAKGNPLGDPVPCRDHEYALQLFVETIKRPVNPPANLELCLAGGEGWLVQLEYKRDGGERRLINCPAPQGRDY